MIQRRHTRQIQIGHVPVGGGAPISVQSMTNTPTEDADATVRQIAELEAVGCDVVRVAVAHEEAVRALPAVVREAAIPVVADVHFDYRLALAALESGVAGLRINPGNIGDRSRVEAVVRAARERGVPIRIGVNAGSLEKRLRERVALGEMTRADALAESAMGHVRILEELDFRDVKISMKASDVVTTVEAHRALAARCDYPFHVGVTEAGTAWSGTIKSAAGIGILLMDGLVDTLRVSLTAPPVEEVRVGRRILQALGERVDEPILVSCPTCGRTTIDLASLAEQIEKMIEPIREPLHVAVMGCEVNGPGEAREADLGIAGGKGEGLLFRRGEVVRKVPQAELADVLVGEAWRMVAELEGSAER